MAGMGRVVALRGGHRSVPLLRETEGCSKVALSRCGPRFTIANSVSMVRRWVGGDEMYSIMWEG